MLSAEGFQGCEIQGGLCIVERRRPVRSPISMPVNIVRDVEETESVLGYVGESIEREEEWL
jgi:hypothetical protein